MTRTSLPIAYLVRHGETEWSASGRHTGLTDLALTPNGQAAAGRLAQRLAGRSFAQVWTSPLQRARDTCRLAGFGDRAEVLNDLVEWDYGAYEGRTGDDIRGENPNWSLFDDGAPDGESPADIAERADRTLKRLRTVEGDVLIFSSGHILRSLAVRFLGLEIASARLLRLDTASISGLGYDHALSEPAIRFWNLTEKL